MRIYLIFSLLTSYSLIGNSQEVIYRSEEFSMGVNFTVDNKYALFSHEGLIRKWNLVTKTFVSDFKCDVNHVEDIDVSPDGKLTALSSQEGLYVINTATGETVYEQVRPGELISYPSGVVRFSTSGKLLSSSVNDSILVLHTDNFTEHSRYAYEYATAVDFSVNDEFIAIGGMDSVRFYKLANGRKVQSVACPAEYPGVNWIRFSPTGIHFISMGFQGSNGIEIRLLPEFELEKQIEPVGHVGDVNGFALSADGQKIAYYVLEWYNLGQEYIPPPVVKIQNTFGTEMSIELPVTKDEITESTEPEYNHLAFTPDGKYLIAGGRSGVIIWKL